MRFLFLIFLYEAETRLYLDNLKDEETRCLKYILVILMPFLIVLCEYIFIKGTSSSQGAFGDELSVNARMAVYALHERYGRIKGLGKYLLISSVMPDL